MRYGWLLGIVLCACVGGSQRAENAGGARGVAGSYQSGSEELLEACESTPAWKTRREHGFRSGSVQWVCM